MKNTLGYAHKVFSHACEKVLNKKGEKIMTKRFGFTLAEVLITLGIIGVVAAMTMPTLINQTNGAQYKAAYKKALSAISQGITLNVALDDISFADNKTAEAGASDTVNSTAYILGQRMNVVKTDKKVGYDAVTFKGGGTDADTNTTLFFNDGSVFQFTPSDVGCTQAYETGNAGTNKVCKGFIDVNGLKGPNKEVTCDETGTNAANASGACTVKSPTDIYPVKYYDQTILPNSDAARAVLYGK